MMVVTVMSVVLASVSNMLGVLLRPGLVSNCVCH